MNVRIYSFLFCQNQNQKSILEIHLNLPKINVYNQNYFMYLRYDFLNLYLENKNHLLVICKLNSFVKIPIQFFVIYFRIVHIMK